VTTRAECEIFRAQLVAIATEHAPASVRHIYYRCVVQGLVAKDNNGYQRVQRELVALRRVGALPYSAIVDHGRQGYFAETHDSVDAALRAVGSSYRRSLWLDSPEVVEVWVESRSIAGVIHGVCGEWDVPLYPCGGQSSDSFIWAAAQQHLYEYQTQLVVIYAGDHDPAGLEIEAQLRAKLVHHLGRPVGWVKVGVTEQDAIELQATGTTPKKREWRDAEGEHHAFYGQAVEAEAITPGVMRSRVEAAITDHVDHNALRLLRIAEESERAGLLRIAGEAETYGIEGLVRYCNET
jgi:hypothetical protein